MRGLIAAVFLMSCCPLGGAQARPLPARALNWSVDRRNIELRWQVPPGEDADIRFYIDICRREQGGWRRIFGAYVEHPPFTFERPAPDTDYAWRVLSVDPADARDFTPSRWEILRTPALPR